MAAFTEDPREWQRLDWQLLHNSPITLYFDPSILDGDVAWFTEQGYRVRSFRVTDHGSSEDVLLALGQLLGFPAHQGRNLDAFDDCLSDVEVPRAGGLLLILRDFDSFAAAAPTVAQALLDVCADNSRRFLLTGKRFLVLVHSADPRIVFEPVGASPVMWNPKEWLNSNRGL